MHQGSGSTNDRHSLVWGLDEAFNHSLERVSKKRFGFGEQIHCFCLDKRPLHWRKWNRCPSLPADGILEP